MTLEEFIKKNLGKKVDFDNYGGAQCVDLIRQYWKDVDGIKEHTGVCASSGGAKDLFLDYPKMPIEQKYFYKVPSSQNIVQGDTLIWNSTDTNKYGHIAIFICKVNESLLVFEQNGFTQNGAEFAIRTKENLLGALRKR